MKRQSEEAEQETFIAWCRQTAEAGFRPLAFMHASLNGVQLSMYQAKQAKRAGMVSGVPDLFLPFPVSPYHGLFVEMKTRKGRLSKTQERFIGWLRIQNYCVIVPQSWGKAKEGTLDYLRGKL